MSDPGSGEETGGQATPPETVPSGGGGNGGSTEPPAAPYKRKATWLRGLFMLLFMIFIEIAEILLGATTVLQFFWLLFTGHPNGYLTRFGKSLSVWLRDSARFQACASDDKPFPWAPWPAADESV